jgi:hypothetical protein
MIAGILIVLVLVGLFCWGAYGPSSLNPKNFK